MAEIIIKKDEKRLSQDVNMVYSAYMEAQRYHRNNLDNTMENWRMYFGKFPELGLGQWPQKIVDDMIQQDRHLIQYNFIMPTIDTLAGSLMQVPFEPDFIPVNSEVTSLTKVIKEAMFSDRELMDWKGPYLDLIKAGLVGGDGCLKMVISNEFSDLGNIGFESTLPGAVLPDPLWKSWSSKDCKVVWKETWMTPEEAANKYNNAGDRILGQARQDKRDGVTYGGFTGVTPYKNDYVSSSWGSSYKFIEEYRVHEVKKRVDYVILGDGTETAIPDDIPDKDRYDWLNATHPDWQPDYCYCEDKIEKVSKVKTVCPALDSDKPFEDGKTEVQIGATPFKFWASSRANGENHAVVDAIKDPQKQMNFWEAMITHKIKTEGGGGAQYVDPGMFISNEEYLKWSHHRNKPAMNFKLKPGYMDKGIVPSKPIQNSPFPREVYENLNHIIRDIWPHVSKVTPSSLGMREQSSDMSGKLYNMMKIQSDLQAYTIHYGLKNFWNEVYEGYLLQAAQTYSNEGLERDFPINGGRETIKLNERVTLEDGSSGIKNDASKLKEIRHKVIISEKQESPSQKAEDVESLSRILQNMPADRVATRNYVTNAIMSKLEQLPPEDKALIEKLGQLELERDVATIEMQTSQAMAQKAQADAMLAQMGQQGPPQGGPPPGEAPSEVSTEQPQAMAKGGAEPPPPIAEGPEPEGLQTALSVGAAGPQEIPQG